MSFKNCIIQEKVPIPRFIIYKTIVKFLKKKKNQSFSTDTRNIPAKVQILLLWLPDFLIPLGKPSTHKPTDKNQNNIMQFSGHCCFLALNTMPSEPFVVSALSQCSNYDMQFKPENYTCQHGKDSSYVMFGRKGCKHSSLAVVDADQCGYMQCVGSGVVGL